VNSLRSRLFLAIGLVAVLSVAVAFLIGAVLTKRAAERATLRDVAAKADLIQERERTSLNPLGRLGTLRRFLRERGERVVRVPLDGSSPYLPPERAAQVTEGGAVNGTMNVDGTRYFFAARLVSEATPDRGRGFVLLRPTESAESRWQPQLEALVVAAVVTAALAALAAFLLARAFARPVRRVAEASRTLAVSGSAEPVPVEGPRELAVLASSFNEMAQQLERAREAERSFLLSVSHELKTPLTAIRGYAEALGDGAVPVDEAGETIRLEAARLERLVGDLLDLARMNKHEFSVRREPIDLAAAAREAVRRHEWQARAFGVSLEAVAADAAPALADSDRTLQVVANLVENALRLAPPGGTVRVVAEPGTIAVEDNGPGLRPDELPRAFERFYLYSRYGKERPVGTGLGLAIVKQLVESMGGAVEVESDPGRLTRFVIRLPQGPPTDGPRPAEPELARA
jgi:two-component system sensor histidine kinase BaeS